MDNSKSLDLVQLFCKACGCRWVVSKKRVRLSDNDWFYCTNCGSGNTEVLTDTNQQL